MAFDRIESTEWYFNLTNRHKLKTFRLRTKQPIIRETVIVKNVLTAQAEYTGLI